MIECAPLRRRHRVVTVDVRCSAALRTVISRSCFNSRTGTKLPHTPRLRRDTRCPPPAHGRPARPSCLTHCETRGRRLAVTGTESPFLTAASADTVTREELLGLKRRLGSLPMIEQSKGLLMAHFGINADLAGYSRSTRDPGRRHHLRIRRPLRTFVAGLMRAAIVTTYPPRPCGIGMFSRDLRDALREVDPSRWRSRSSLSCAITSSSPIRGRGHDPAGCSQRLRAVPALLTVAGTDVVLIEHEYGIFGGEAGEFVVSLVRGTGATVGSHPAHGAVGTDPASGRGAARTLPSGALVTVFTETARRMIIDARIVTPERVRVLPHGAPTVLVDASCRAGGRRPRLRRGSGTIRRPDPPVDLRADLGREGDRARHLRPPCDGAAASGRSLPGRRSDPSRGGQDRGRTLPARPRATGPRARPERARAFPRPVPHEAELAFLLSSTDLYLTPYRSREQIVSGALTFAVAAGCPVVSTPYFYAEDLLVSGAGVLVPFDDAAAMSAAVLDLLDNPDKRERARVEARRIGSALAWPRSRR